MSLMESIVIGAIQGLTEVWPVSADGHLLIINYFFGFQSPLGLGFILRAALILAVVAGFAREIWHGIRNPNWKHFSYYLIAAIPFLLVQALQALFFPAVLDLIWLVAPLLVANGVLLVVGDGFQKRKETGDVTYWGAIFVGLVQVFAVLPGLSPLALALFATLIWGLRREEAVKFAFLVSLPVNILVLGFQMLDLYRHKGTIPLSMEELAGGIAAFIAATLGIYFFKKLALHKLTHFAIYCISVAILLFILLILGL